MSPVTNKTAAKETDEIDLGRLLGELIDHRKLIISVTSLCTLIALIYALFSTPIYQSDALIQVEQKQGNAILSNLTQMLPDSQPSSAPEITLLQSRMILGKTVSDLNLQAKAVQNYFPIFGRGWARLMGDKPGKIEITRLYLSNSGDDTPNIVLTVKDSAHYKVEFGGEEFEGKVGELLDAKDISLKISSLQAEPGTEFSIYYISKLKAITDLQNEFYRGRSR